MPFDVELAFTGLGVVLLRSAERRPHNPSPDSVEFLLLRTQGPAPQESHGDHYGRNHSQRRGEHDDEHRHDEPHLPRLWFRLEDLVDVNVLFEDMVAGPDGLPVVRLPLDDKDFTITVEEVEEKEESAAMGQQGFDVQWRDRRGSTVSSSLDFDFDLDFIPDLTEHFGIEDPALPDTESLPGFYTARVKLPAGRITTRRPLLNPDQTIAEWAFVEEDGKETTAQPLTDQVIWSRKNVKAFHIDNAFRQRLTFDSSLRQRHGDDARVTLAITNLPGTGTSGRFGSPGHFALLRQVSRQGGRVREIQRRPSLSAETPITVGGACPPARQEGLGS